MEIAEHYQLKLDQFTQRASIANYFRNIAFSIDQEPENITDHIHHPFMDSLLHDEDSSCFDQVSLFHLLAYGDVGVLLACPGPSFAGLIVRELAHTEQKEYFFSEIKKRRARTFFAVKESLSNKIATQAVQTYLTQNKHHYVLNGSKWLVGNGAVADLGVVVVRHAVDALRLGVVLLAPEIITSSSVERIKLPMLGLRGAQLSYLKFTDTKINQFYLLGDHSNSSDHGMIALNKTYNRIRLCVAALALGLSQAILDYVAENHQALKLSGKHSMKNFYCNFNVVKKIVYESAVQIDQNPLLSETTLFAKCEAIQFAEKIIMQVNRIISPGCIMEHPFLLKWQRDLLGLDYLMA